MIKICLKCQKEFKTYDSRSKFCSRTCSAVFNNSFRDNPKTREKTTCQCGNKKTWQAKTCLECKLCNGTKIKFNYSILEKTNTKGASREKYSEIRTIAKSYFKLLQIPKECKICKFNLLVDLAHIKPICEFDEHDLISEVNLIDNLVYLCPNHHKCLDKGIISYKDYDLSYTLNEKQQIIYNKIHS